MTSDVAAAGLVLDVAGAVVLAYGLMAKRPAEILDESATYYGRNTFVMVALIRQRTDAQIGGTLLALGFVFQILGARASDPSWLAPESLTLIVFVLLVVALEARRVLNEHAIGRAVGAVLAAEWRERPKSTDPQASESAFEQLAEARLLALGPRDERESIADYGRRMIGSRNWSAVERVKAAVQARA